MQGLPLTLGICLFLLLDTNGSQPCSVLEIHFRGHSKSTFVEEGRGGGGIEKRKKRTTREGGSWHVCTLAFLEKDAEIFKIVHNED